MAAAAIDRLELALDGIDQRCSTPPCCCPRSARARSPSSAARTTRQARAALAAIEHAASRRTVDAERAFLAELGGDCDLPAGAHATLDGDELVLEALLASPDGHTVLREVRRGTDPDALGAALAVHLLDGAGGRSLLSW